MEPHDARVGHVDCEIDARLAARPLRPDRHFAERVFARMEADARVPHDDPDARLAATPLRVSPDFTDRVLAAVAAARRRRFRVLLGAPLAAAAALAVGFFVFGHSADSVDVRLARLLAEDAELKSMAAYAVTSHEAQLATDLAALADLGVTELVNEPSETAS